MSLSALLFPFQQWSDISRLQGFVELTFRFINDFPFTSCRKDTAFQRLNHGKKQRILQHRIAVIHQHTVHH
jgi:hypothetical protein